MINEREFLAFIERILTNSPKEVAEDRCAELVRVLREQNVLTDELNIAANRVILSIPELYDIFPEGNHVTLEGLEEASRRSDERRRREAEAERYGRC